MKRTLWLLIGCVLFFSSCRWDVDAWWSDEAGKEESRIFRYDRLVDEFVSLNSFSALQRMNTEFPTPTRLLIEDVLGIGRVEDAHIEQHLRDYFLDSTMQVLLQDVHSEYSDLSEEEEKDEEKGTGKDEAQGRDEDDVPGRLLEKKERANQGSDDTQDDAAKQEGEVPRDVPHVFVQTCHKQSLLHALFTLLQKASGHRNQGEGDH